MIEINKIGFIDVTEEAYENFWLNNRWFVPLSIETQLRNRTKRLLCACEHFRPLREEEAIPTYSATFEKGICDNIILKEVEELK